MSEMTREELLGVVRRVWTERDPVPAGLVERMQAAVATAATGSESLDLDYELLVLVERSHELAGTRAAVQAGSAYTLQFAHGDLALLVRVAAEEQPGEGGRLDGWLAPTAQVTVTARLVSADASWETRVDDRGRFEFGGLPSGLYRLYLTPDDPDTRPFATPAFEL